MIICISANPAIDRRLRLESIAVGGVNRAVSAQPFPGGKAAHVAMVARALGAEVTWVGFLGGAAGEDCESGLSARDIPLTVVRTRAETRANLEIIADDGTVTEILEPGGGVTEGEVERLLSACIDTFAESGAGTQVAISGSLLPGTPPDFYAELIRIAHSYGCRVLLDTSGEPLRQALAAAPDLVKPNRNEAASYAGRPVHTAEMAMVVSQDLIKAGARGVAVSLGAAGMVWQRCGNSATFFCEAPRIIARSSVGSGDAALAAFAVAHERGLGDEETLSLAVACGTANCLAEAPGLIDQAEVERINRQVYVTRLRADYREVETNGVGR